MSYYIPATSEQARLYAVQIINDQFDPGVAEVCQCLLSAKRALLLAEICANVESNVKPRVPEILENLICHNYVQRFSVEMEVKLETKKKKKVMLEDESKFRYLTHYLVLLDNILHRQRQSKFAAVVDSELGAECGAVLRHLHLNGSLTLEMLILTIRNSEEHNIGPRAVKESLKKLVAAHFVERSPLDPSFGRDLPRRRGATYPLFFDNLILLKNKVLQTATPAEEIRFPLTAFANTDSNIAKRKRKPDVDASDPSKLITWRPNFEEFISRLRHKACLDIVKKNKGEECAAVLRAMLNVKSAEEKVEKGQSGRMSVGSFSKEVKTEDGHPLLHEKVVECLGKLSSSSSSSSSSLPAFVIEMDGSYRVDFESIISVQRYHEMKAAVKRTYGEEFSQMFNYLLEKEDCLFETSEIVRAVGIEEEAALRGLFDMRKGGYVRMEKLLVRGVDMPILQWKINRNFVIRTMLNLWYDASKLILLKKGREIPPHIFPTEYELDDAIMIFHDY